MWETLVAADKANDIITCGSHSTPSGSHDQKDPTYGIAYNHAYTVVGVKELSNGVKFVRVRNPWGTETYNGPWNDSDERWTPELREEIGVAADNDGIWHAPLEDYHKMMELTSINKNTTGWKYDYFLKLGDKTGPNGKDEWCGEKCTRHEL